MERTCVIIKPDGIQRNLVGEIISCYERGGLKLKAIKIVKAEPDSLRKHYSAHVDKPFYSGLETYMTEGPVIIMIFEGENAIKRVREITGHTDPSKADKGTIRGDLGEDSFEKADSEGRGLRNLVHASGTPEEAEKEIELWFEKGDILE
ncbi:MAG: nucleoside-diphosphate kinase [Candidatus Aenigmarchaeota archaeon]